MHYGIKVLDKGSVELVDYMGSDMSVVNAARVSLNKDKYVNVSTKVDGIVLSPVRMTDKDIKLIKYMMNEGHTSPFEHVVFTFMLNCPLFVRSQIHRHRTFSYNEISRRYTSEDIGFYVPNRLRKQADNDRQASADDYLERLYWNEPYYLEHGEHVEEFFRKVVEYSMWAYNTMLDNGVAREQARMILPQNLYTRFYMTGNLHNWFHFLELRDSEHSQWETRQYAIAIRDVIKRIVPVCFEAWETKE